MWQAKQLWKPRLTDWHAWFSISDASSWMHFIRIICKSAEVLIWRRTKLNEILNWMLSWNQIAQMTIHLRTSESNYIIYHNLLFCSRIKIIHIGSSTYSQWLYINNNNNKNNTKTAIYLKSVSGNICPRQRVPVFLKISMPENEKRCLLSSSSCGSFLCPNFLLSCFTECSEVSRLEWLESGLLSHLSRALTLTEYR